MAGPKGIAICDECAELANRVASEALRPTGDDLVLTGIGRLITNDSRGEGLLGEVKGAAIAVRRGRVSWVGDRRDLPHRYADLPALSCGGRAGCPGFVDASARLLVKRVEARLDPDSLVDDTTARIREMLARGTTALDLRAGGTGDPTKDTTLLASARAAADQAAGSVSITWVAGGMDAETVEEVMAPTAARLASAAEITCDGDGGGLRLAEAVRNSGRMPLRMRPCREAHDGCLETAQRSLGMEGWTVRLAEVDGPVPVVETVWALGGWPLPTRALWDAGRRCALASGTGAGGTYVDGMGLVMSLAVNGEGLPPAQALWSVTRGGALAVGDRERGRLRLGAPADIVILDTDEPTELAYRPDGTPIWKVVLGGAPVER